MAWYLRYGWHVGWYDAVSCFFGFLGVAFGDVRCACAGGRAHRMPPYLHIDTQNAHSIGWHLPPSREASGPRRGSTGHLVILIKKSLSCSLKTPNQVIIIIIKRRKWWLLSPTNDDFALHWREASLMSTW